MKYKNNPFNIRSGSRWIGLSGTKNGFCEFDTLEHGVRAACILLMVSYRKKGVFTIRGIINRFAPPSENDTLSYMTYVSDTTNFFVNTPLNHFLQYCSILQSIAFYETKTRISLNFLLYVLKTYNINVYCLTPKK